MSPAPDAERTGVRVRFHGHACIELQDVDGVRICVDPFESGGFGGAVALPPLPDHFAAWVASHDHVDHSAGHTIPQAERLVAPTRAGRFHVDTHTAFHDEFGGRLRGGSTDALRFTADGVTILHCGDLGERPDGALLAWMQERPIDLLVVPVGGYFTLGPDGAAELTATLAPRFVLPCHSADDGVRLPQLGPRRLFDARFERHDDERDELLLVPAEHDGTTVLHLLRPHLGT